MTAETAQNVGARFSRQAMLAARERSWAALGAIAARIVPGMTETDAAAVASECLAAAGMQRIWHPSIIRFGPNTLKTFRQRSAPDTRLGDHDIFFVDLGPVFDGHEGDVGDTFVTGGDAQMTACATAARELFDLTAARWREGVTGTALYAFADEQARAMGWRLNHATKGHRVGDYPHAVHKAGNLGDLDATPVPGLWILEIQIAHPDRPIGAFFEDLLIA
ncbi:Metallopeptidase family M24 [Luteibacter sp. UNCMF331Sha3.1]|uniref:M24 family metallopeptidase n=1 Tax=Luteibacter sp. UNCMF331Sha3.1 TaxID=1502760 RepID=UPI0008D28625|nr:M24 family metallopeptidase [Luteibacter sp. UNCMF331Sha3.1]SEM53010.1 Metallopeptidase family M24 [Luteibacter sp. UNCMF331Sha3.1]